MSEVAIEGADVNTDIGFNAFLAQQIGGSLTDEQRELLEGADRTIEMGLTTEESASQVRDEKGRFAPAAQESEQGEGVASKETVDDTIAELLGRHDNDASKALEAVLRERDEAQSLIGRQGNELGDLRREMAELRGRFEERSQAQIQPQSEALVSTQDIEQAIAARDGKGHGVMEWVVRNAPNMIEETLDIWAQYDPAGAARYAGRLGYFEAHELGGQSQPTAQDPSLQEFKVERTMRGVLDGISKDYTERAWETIKGHLGGVMDSLPEAIQADIVSGDSQKTERALGLAVKLAKAEAVEAATTKAREEQAAATTAAKNASKVATGSLQPVRERQPSGQSEDNIKKFYEQFMRTETTSVADGLTFGK